MSWSIEMSSLLNSRVLLRVSDPWEIGEAIEWRALEAQIVAVGDNAVLLRLRSPFEHKGVSCEYFVASPRHGGANVNALESGNSVFCSMTRVPVEQASSPTPFDLGNWRGGVAIIGNLDPLGRIG